MVVPIQENCHLLSFLHLNCMLKHAFRILSKLKSQCDICLTCKIYSLPFKPINFCNTLTFLRHAQGGQSQQSHNIAMKNELATYSLLTTILPTNSTLMILFCGIISILYMVSTFSAKHWLLDSRNTIHFKMYFKKNN